MKFKCIFFLTLCIFSLSASDEGFQGWTHLELGAGNYGQDGHTQESQRKTVLMKLLQISEKENYVDKLEEFGTGDYDPFEQYGVLFWTLDQLVQRYGNEGVFHVNDLYEDYAVYAAGKLREYAQEKGYFEVKIDAVPGDYADIDPDKRLMEYGKKKYDSVHLKNPEVSFYYEAMDGDNFYTSEESRQKTRALLQKLANLSCRGIYLFILHHKNFLPIEEQEEFAEKNIFYKETEDWESVPYIFPEGDVIGKEWSKVFFIPAQAQFDAE